MTKKEKEFNETPGTRLRDLDGDRLRHLFHVEEHTLGDIAMMCGCSVTAVWKKMQRLNIDTGRTRFDSKPSDSLSYVLGAMLGDGSIYVNTDKGTYKLTLGTKSTEFLDKFEKHLNDVKVRIRRIKHGKYWRTESNNKKFVTWYQDLDYNDIREVIKGHEIGFLQGFWDAEGHASIGKKGEYHVNMSNTDEWLLDIVKDVVKNLGFKFSIYNHDDGVTECFTLNIRGGKDACIKFLSIMERDVK